MPLDYYVYYEGCPRRNMYQVCVCERERVCVWMGGWNYISV